MVTCIILDIHPFEVVMTAFKRQLKASLLDFNNYISSTLSLVKGYP